VSSEKQAPCGNLEPIAHAMKEDETAADYRTGACNLVSSLLWVTEESRCGFIVVGCTGR
jgi:hypothetical protein